MIENSQVVTTSNLWSDYEQIYLILIELYMKGEILVRLKREVTRVKILKGSNSCKNIILESKWEMREWSVKMVQSSIKNSDIYSQI